MIKQCIWNMKAVINEAFPDIAIEESWVNICNNVEKIRPLVRSTVVSRKKPIAGRIKLNTDGSFYKDTNKAGIAGVVRNERGDFIMTYSVPVHSQSNNQTEALAVKFGVQWCMQQQFTLLDIELDSLVISNMLINKDTNNLKLKHIVSGIVNHLTGIQYAISHCYRETNQTADHLAKMASTSGTRTLYHSLKELHREAKGLLQLDKWQTPTFRRRYEKCNFFVS
ncbi:hypothetical protein MTR67_020350 [Solanum verrucosum]|uniref:RNase H type-1 domain-containing protein n=1 Tax=Solanum verrucosum TaxID=315347 RepID=A0AAF0TUS5_SOLVR|nr:hypothetical protein MTR67_020350 [Solanum verrucosum]